jgi:two-component system sensor histidine kinase GlrK
MKSAALSSASSYYPRSFTVLVMVAMGVLTVPLASGLISTVQRMQGVMDTQRQFTRDSLGITRDLRQIVDGVNQLQRAAGQYHLLQDKELATSLAGSYHALDAQLADLGPLLASRLPREALRSVGTRSEALYRRVAPGRFLDSVAFNALKPDFDALHDAARALQIRGDAFVHTRLGTLETEMQSTQRRLLLLTLALIPLTVVLAAIFSWMINRPIRQLKAAIQQLARGDLGRLPPINGPQDIVELHQEIDWLRQRLGEIETQKTRFMQHVSHELKTPLASLREGVGLLAERLPGPLNARQLSIVEIMNTSSRELQRRIEDLIRYSGMLQHTGNATITPLSLQNMLAAVQARHRLALDTREIVIDTELDTAPVYADREQLETVIDNLLSNALKFSPQGGHILIRSELSANTYHVRVCDQGPGIAAAERPRIFDAFVQGASQPKSAVKGSGLGLAIVRETLRGMGGQVSVGDLPSWSVCLDLQWPQPQTEGHK